MRSIGRSSSLLAGVALLAAGWSLTSCLLDPRFGFQVSGRLEKAFGCYVLASQGWNYELTSWRDPVPPAGSFVTLRVRSVGGASICMVGPMVEVLRVVSARTDFRTAPVSQDETWGPDEEPLLGQVEVQPGATLTILPGTVVTITDYGRLRVRGSLVMVGTPDDSIHVVGTRPGSLGGGGVVIDSVATARLEYASVASLTVHGIALQRVRADRLVVNAGRTGLRDVIASSMSVQGGRVAAEDCDLGLVDGIFAELAIRRSRMIQLSLSYSKADVSDSRFEGNRSYVLFHGASSGTFERNVLRADETTIEVRHTSTPVFHDNDFISPSMRVECETYQLQTCVSMERNWWGTTDESQIRSKIQTGSPVCFEPWRTEPVGMAGPPYASAY